MLKYQQTQSVPVAHSTARSFAPIAKMTAGTVGSANPPVRFRLTQNATPSKLTSSARHIEASSDGTRVRNLITQKLNSLQVSTWALTSAQLVQAFGSSILGSRRFLAELCKFSKLDVSFSASLGFRCHHCEAVLPPRSGCPQVSAERWRIGPH